MVANVDDEFRISKERAEGLRSKFPEKYPVVVGRVGEGIEIQKRKYLASSTSTMGELMFSIRRYISLKKHEAMFLYVNSGLVPTNALVSDIWAKSNDGGCLYIELHKESTFGA